MKTRKKGRRNSRFGTVSIAGAMSLLACSKVDTVTPSDTGDTTQVSTCGSLDPAVAAQLATTRLEHLGTVGLAALSGLENSRAAARLLSFGDGSIIDPFVSESQSELHDALVELRDKQLVASNVETASDASVTFLLRPETVCEQEPTGVAVPIASVGGAAATGGTTSSGGSGGKSSVLDPACVKKQTENPTRIRISRIACDQGDNVALEILYGPSSRRVILGELYGEHAELELDLGVYLGMLTNTSYSSTTSANGTVTESSTTEPVVSSAVGKLRGTLSLNGNSQASGRISVSEAIDVTLADESAARIRLAAGTDVATISADGAAKSIKVTSNIGAFDWRARFADFVQDFFDLTPNASAAAQAPVDIHVPGLRGSVTLDGTKDEIVAEGLDLGMAPATVIQGTRSLLSVTAANAQRGAISATLTGRVDNGLGLGLPAGLNVEIRYGLEPVMSTMDNPANYLASDTLTINASTGSVLTLIPETTPDDLAVTSSQVGTLLRVDAGTVALSSSVWPNDAVSVAASQCLSRTPAGSTGRNDLLDDFVIGACVQ